MTDPADLPDLPPPAAPPEPRKKGHPVIAWLVIAAVVALILWHPWETRMVAEGNEDRPESVLLRLLGRYIVGATDGVPTENRKPLYRELASLNTGPVGQRLRFIVLAGELQGPDEALKQLGRLRGELAQGEVKGDPADGALVDVLRHLYGDYADKKLDAPSVPEAEREQLRERLGWFGELALAPDGGPREARAAVLAPARRTALALNAGIATAAAVGLMGFAALVPFLILLLMGRLRSGLPGPFEYGGVYAEAFAVWMVLFVGLSLVVAHLDLPTGELMVHAGVDLLSVAGALAWPLLRGVPYARLRQDVGLTLGRDPALEPFLGVACYAMALPLLAVGVLLTRVLIWLQGYLGRAHGGGGPPNLPSHPIVQVVGNPDWRILLQLLFLASVVAPVVEETVFRGLLYRQLREATGRWGRAASVLASAAAVSFLFAAIHPQGWTAIPVLMSLAFAFSLMREWRGTLIPCMIAHGINNGLVLVFLHFALGG